MGFNGARFFLGYGYAKKIYKNKNWNEINVNEKDTKMSKIFLKCYCYKNNVLNYKVNDKGNLELSCFSTKYSHTSVGNENGKN